jgi:hypothetical protein
MVVQTIGDFFGLKVIEIRKGLKGRLIVQAHQHPPDVQKDGVNLHFSHLLVTKRRKGWPDKARN